MTPKMQRIFTWSGVVMMTFFLIGFQIAHFVPPPSPTRSVSYISSYFQHHATAIRAGLFTAGCAVALVATWSVAISMQLKRISPKHSGSRRPCQPADGRSRARGELRDAPYVAPTPTGSAPQFDDLAAPRGRGFRRGARLQAAAAAAASASCAASALSWAARYAAYPSLSLLTLHASYAHSASSCASSHANQS